MKRLSAGDAITKPRSPALAWKGPLSQMYQEASGLSKRMQPHMVKAPGSRPEKAPRRPAGGWAVQCRTTERWRDGTPPGTATQPKPCSSGWTSCRKWSAPVGNGIVLRRRLGGPLPAECTPLYDPAPRLLHAPPESSELTHMKGCRGLAGKPEG